MYIKVVCIGIGLGIGWGKDVKGKERGLIQSSTTLVTPLRS